MEEIKHEASFNDEGDVVLKSKEKVKQGKKSRAAGSRFELRVREYWESKGWMLDKWNNNVDLDECKLVKAKRKYNPFKKMLVVGTGFPDFVAIKFIREGIYDVMGIEVKMNGTLSKEEKLKCKWLLENNIFSVILVASKGEKRGEIKFDDFRERYGKVFT